MEGKKKLMSLLGSAVILGLGAEGATLSYAGEGKCAGMKGEAQQKAEESTKEEKKKHYYRREIRKGAFERVIALPSEVVGEKAEAEHKNGLLRIVIPKARKSPKAKKIAVKAKK